MNKLSNQIINVSDLQVYAQKALELMPKDSEKLKYKTTWPRAEMAVHHDGSVSYTVCCYIKSEFCCGMGETLADAFNNLKCDVEKVENNELTTLERRASEIGYKLVKA